ncbi:MAG: ABC transporter substrate-binding protein [Planctomycetes bacterium]|nr:ABC transporter substrate-binding protein [Planctomycetota bacterium]
MQRFARVPAAAHSPTPASARSRTLALAFLACLLACAAGCERTAPPVVPPPLRIGYSDHPSCWPVLIALDRGFLQRDDPEVQVVRTASLARGIEDLLERKLDGNLQALCDILPAASAGVPLLVGAVLAEAGRLEAIVAAQGVEGPAQLASTEIAVEAGSHQLVSLKGWALRAGIAPGTLRCLDERQEDAFADLLAGRVRAAVLSEPLLGRAQAAGLRTFPLSRDDLPPVVHVLAVQRPAAEGRNPALRTFVRAWRQAVAALASEPGKSLPSLSARTGLPEDEVRRTLAAVHFASVDEERDAFGDPGRPSTLEKNYALIAEVHRSERWLLSVPTLREVLDPALRIER